MTANKILNNYLIALKMSDGSPLELNNVILDILKYLAEKESNDTKPRLTVRGRYMVLGVKNQPLDINLMEVCEKDNLMIMDLNTAFRFLLWCKNQKEDTDLFYAKIFELIEYKGKLEMHGIGDKKNGM